MKKKIIITAFILIIFSSCKDDSSITDPVKTNNGITSISGTVENWNYGTKTLKLPGLATALINPDGYFYIELLITPTQGGWTPEFPNDSVCSGNVAINPPNSQFWYPNFLVYDGDSVIGFLYKANDFPQQGFAEAMYYCAAQDGSITGTYICKLPRTEIYLFNYSYVKGWNVEYEKIPIHNSDTIKYVYDNIEPPGLKWRFWPSMINGPEYDKFINRLNKKF